MRAGAILPSLMCISTVSRVAERRESSDMKRLGRNAIAVSLESVYCEMQCETLELAALHKYCGAKVVHVRHRFWKQAGQVQVRLRSTSPLGLL